MHCISTNGSDENVVFPGEGGGGGWGGGGPPKHIIGG